MSTKLVKKDSEFSEVLGIIRAGRAKAYKAFNVVLIDTYWAVGAHLSSRVAGGGWGKGVVLELSEWLLRKAPHLKGFSASNLWRMKQFYEVYADEPKLAPLVRVLSWSHNLMIMGQNKRPEEREFYLRLAVGVHVARSMNSKPVTHLGENTPSIPELSHLIVLNISPTTSVFLSPRHCGLILKLSEPHSTHKDQSRRKGRKLADRSRRCGR
jgi:DUF1016 N-terminal domain